MMNHTSERGGNRAFSRTDELSTMLRGDRGRERSILAAMIVGFLAWVFIYLLLQGQNGFFAITADRVDSLWVKLTVLNIPLHLTLTLAVIGCAGAGSHRLHHAGVALGAVNALLIVSHVVLSVATA